MLVWWGCVHMYRLLAGVGLVACKFMRWMDVVHARRVWCFEVFLSFFDRSALFASLGDAVGLHL